MKSSTKKRTALGAAVLTVAGMSACGDGGPGQPPAAQQRKLDSAQVLALARQPSETAVPFDVNSGLLELTDTSDTAEPIAVNAQ